MKYKYLLWDIDGTVLDFKAAERAAIRKLFVKHDLGECTDEMLARYSRINAKYWKALERKEMTREEILVGRFREFFKTEGLDDSKAEVFNEDYQPALGDTIVFCDDSKAILAEEKKQGFILAAITNGTALAQHKKLSGSGLDQVFDYIFISEAVGYDKPGVEYFKVVFEEMKITNPEEVLIIGDSLTSDIQGGINVGVDTCWYNPDGKENDSGIVPTYTVRDLHELLLL